jgi:hypothetical protein
VIARGELIRKRLLTAARVSERKHQVRHPGIPA